MATTRTNPKTHLFGSLVSAFRAAGSLRSGEQPSAADLRTLGIEAVEFRTLTKR